MEAGQSYEDAVDSAKTKYKKYLKDLKDTVAAHKHLVDSLRNTLPPGDTLIPLLDSLSREDSLTIHDLGDSIDDGSPSWVRFQFKEYCEWKKVHVQPGGQLVLDFKGSGGCGNVTVYCEDAGGAKRKVRIWNWNLPGSSGYVAGNERRVLNADPACSTGVYWIHNDNGEFTLTVESATKQTLPETPSNIPTFSGFSMGGNDSSMNEFRLMSLPGVFIPNVDQEGFVLKDAPAILGPCGVQQLTAGFNPIFPNPWWGDMEVYLNVLQVIQPGELVIQCPSAQFPVTTISITSPGIYIAHLGAIEVPSTGALTLDGSSGICVALDSWGLRTLVPTFPPSYMCGDVNDDTHTNIADAVYIINYVFVPGSPAPEPVESGDVNCDGHTNIADAVYIINYVFIPGSPAPCAHCK